MKKALLLSFICASSLSAMNGNAYRDVPITIENKCAFPISVNFDAFELYPGVSIPLSVQSDHSTYYVIARGETKKALFPRLAKYKDGVMVHALSKGRAYIRPALSPIEQSSKLYFDSSSETQKLVVSDQNGLTATVKEI
jgi:hypothetical protein